MSCTTDASGINDISGVIHAATSDAYLLTQEDFAVPYVIDKPGIYTLTEDIKINFYPKPYDIFNVETTGDDFFGFPAAIKIVAKHVILDLSGHTLYQSPQDFCVQRFFALIQLNNSPFPLNHGPIPESKSTLTAASYCMIINGELGLTAHQAVLGNDNSHLVFQDLVVKDFEVTGFTLNNVETAYFQNVTIARSIGVQRALPVSPYFSGLIFNYRLLKLTYLKFFLSTVEAQSVINTNNHIRANLTPFLNVIYSYSSLSCIYDQLKHVAYKCYPYLVFLFNDSQLSPCGMHGIKITGPNPSISKYHNSLDEDTEKRFSKHIYIYDSSINQIKGKVGEQLLVTKCSKIVHIGAGLKLGASLLSSKVICDLLKTMALLTLNPNVKGFIRTTVDSEVVNFVISGKNPTGHMGFTRSHDIMGHLNKGVHGIRFGSSCHVELSGVDITNIVNEGTALDPATVDCLRKKYTFGEVEFAPSSFLTPINYTGTYAIGAIFSGCEICDISDVNIYDITAPYGASVGLGINNVCENFSVANTNIYDLVSNTNSFDSATFVVDVKSKNVTTNNLVLNPAGTSST